MIRAAAAVLALAALGLGLAIPGARGSYPGVDGRIVFVRQIVTGQATSLTALETIRADGTDVRALTEPAADTADYEPVWSPDGSQVAFVRRDLRTPAGATELYIVNADGTGLRRLTDDPADEWDPTWSPDGSRIAFTRYEPDRHVWVMAADGSRARRVTKFVAQAPVWSPEGSWIAYLIGPWIERIHPNGEGRRKIVRSTYYVSKSGAGERVEWNPSGTRLAIVEDVGALITLAPDGTHRRVLGDGFDPGWSPDGKALALTAYSPGAFGTRLEIVRPDGSGRRALTDSAPPTYDFNPDWQPVCSKAGSAGADRLTGTRRADILCGLAGDDRITGGPGPDRLFGDDGNDTIRSRDGARDIIGCGSGRDTVIADRRDLVGVDCEDIRRG